MNTIIIIIFCSYFSSATEHDPTWYKAWHAFAFMNLDAVHYYTTNPNKSLEQKGERIGLVTQIYYTIILVKKYTDCLICLFVWFYRRHRILVNILFLLSKGS